MFIKIFFQWYENEIKCEIKCNRGKTLVCLNLKFQMILQIKTRRVLGLANCCPCTPMMVSLSLFLVFAFHLYIMHVMENKL